ncbi:MAG TPA: deoxyribose-phosphate aldolase [Clostridium sp.]
MEISKYIDHTILKPDATADEVKKVCSEAREYNFASVCINPYYAKLVSTQLVGTDVKTCVVVGFPLGANTQEVKAFESSNAVANGAQEVDMVINIAALKDKEYDVVANDIKAVVASVKGKALVKVIIECCLLTKEEMVMACKLSLKAGTDFVKTSTGFSTSGAKPEDVKLMRETVGENIGVKAAGGIRDYKTTMEMINAGANRIGASAGIVIVKEANKQN